VDRVIGVLDFVEDQAHLGGVEGGVMEVFDEVGEGLFEEDVILPEGVVGVDPEGPTHD